MTNSHTRIHIYISHENGYIWTPEEVYTVRTEHHITGILVGTLPSASQQNVFLGLPLLLLPEEVVYLVDKGVASLTDDIAAHAVSPSTEALTRWNEFYKAESLARSSSSMSEATPSTPKGKKKQKELSAEVVDAKRAERLARRHAAPAASDEIIPTSEEVVVVPSASSNLSPASSSTSTPWRSLIVPTLSTSLPWYPSSSPTSAFARASPITASLLTPPPTPSSSSPSPLSSSSAPHVYTTLTAAREAGVWTYPSTPEERAKCAMFKDLNEKGYWMGGGLKFGGDWLVYPGDPLRYHSHFVATSFPTPTSSLRPMQIVALGRLGTATKKAHLLCGWDEKRGEVDYYSIEWAGFG